MVCVKRNILILIFIISTFIFIVSTQSTFAAEKAVKASLPTFKVQINGTVINSKKAEYPLLLYKNITYMPMTYDYCNLLGLESSWTEKEGLKIALRAGKEIPTVNEPTLNSNNTQNIYASIVSTPITINGKQIDNQKEPYPFLRYRDITYFPMTYKFTNGEFNIYSNFLKEYGLGVYSENKFWYNYYPKGSSKQYKDLRLSSILYKAVAINVDNGTGEIPYNNIKEYAFQGEKEYLQPNYQSSKKYYGFLPDGKGGFKVNTESKLFIGNLVTSIIEDLQNPVPIVQQIEIAQYYNQ
ncbi:MAG: hypothetical protein ACK5MV_06460 [Aminipila sp.]